jgi:hypothetical protein
VPGTSGSASGAAVFASAARGVPAAAGYFSAVLFGTLFSLGVAKYYGRLSFATLRDPDSWMHAVLLRHAIATGSWSQIVARGSSGAGTSLHWSRLVEASALPFVLASRPFLGLERAIVAVGALYGPVALGCLAAALCWAAAPFVAWRRGLTLIPAAVVTAPALINYGAAGVFGHHIVIIACAAMAWGHAARACLAQRRGLGHAAGAGIWCGIGVWISIETMPLAMMALGALALLWLRDGDRPALRRVAGCAGAFLLLDVTAWLVDRPNGGLFAIEVDRLSWPYIVLLALLVLAALVLGWSRPASLARRGAALAGLGVLFGGAWLLAFPQFLAGGRQFMPPGVERLIWDNIEELRGADTFRLAIGYGYGGFVALAVLAWALVRRTAGGPERALTAYALVCAAALVAVGMWHLRFSVYAAAAGAAALAVAAGWIKERWGLVPAAAAAALLLAADPAVVRATPGATLRATPAVDPVPEAALWLSGRHGVVLAPMDDGPELLWRTRMMVVASLYHRAGAAQARWLRVMRAVTDAEARAALAAAKADFLLLTRPPPGKRPPYLGDTPETAIERWRHGVLPYWLRVRDRDPATGLVLLERVR